MAIPVLALSRNMPRWGPRDGSASLWLLSLTKPLREQELLDAIQVAIERDRFRRQEASVIAELQVRFNSLTAREREVFTVVVTGRPNKLIAAQLDLSEMTVKVHRSQITRKMQAKSLVDLVRMADKLGISPVKS
jgi:FixJ family two-component response regulator